MSNSDSELNSSELGTKQYWDNVYKADKESFSESRDAGEIWFGMSTLRLIVKYISSVAKTTDTIVDLGCGNGMLLIQLWKAGFKSLHGLDYSADAVQLAVSIAENEGCLAHFNVCDLVHGNPPEVSFNIAVDKGTYDAISLDPDNAVAKRKAYLQNVALMIAPQGLLIIATCNWSQEEIVDHVLKATTLQFVEKLDCPEFKFGGKSGSRVTTVVFAKNIVSNIER